MTSRIVADGASRLPSHTADPKVLARLRREIQDRYAPQLAEAGFFRRLVLLGRIRAEFHRERLKLQQPSPYSLY